MASSTKTPTAPRSNTAAQTASRGKTAVNLNLYPKETIALSDLANLIRSNLKALWNDDEEMARTLPPTMIWGAPGVGKSTVIRELTQEMGIGFIDVRLAQRDPVDMRGLPVPSGDQVRWLVSSEWPRDPESKGVIIFDELPAADKTLLVSAYEFILDRKLGDLYQVPKNWYIVAAGNRPEDRAVASSMPSALSNRFLHVEIKPTASDFLSYAAQKEMHPAVIDFIRTRPKLLFAQKDENMQRGWPTPRSWERVSTILKISDDTGDKKSLQYTVPGLVGMAAATEFLAFYNEQALLKSNDNIRERLLNGTELILPPEADRSFALSEAVILFITQEKEMDIQQKMFENFIAASMDWSSDYAAMVLNGVMKGVIRSPRRKQNLLSAKRLKVWIAKHHLENASCLNK